jgi:spore coat polysaccharide biosynthesis protein SpsF
MITFLLRRLRPIRRATLILATTDLSADDELAELAALEGAVVFRGADEDVVGRYVAAAERFALDTVARVTADCPFVNAELVDYCLECAERWPSFDLATTKTRFPVGLDTEIYRAAGMAQLHRSGRLTPMEREHLTLHYYNQARAYDIRYIEPLRSWKSDALHFTVDTRADYERASCISAALPAGDDSLAAVLQAGSR